MKKSRIHMLHLWLFFLPIALSIVCGCSEDQGGIDTQTVEGNVSMNLPLEGATVSFYSVEGFPITTASTTTSELGNFYSTDAPDFVQFVIVVRGGNFDGNPFDGTLKYWVDGRDSDFYSVNSLTTLIAEYEQEHPELTSDMIYEDIRRFLEIPSYVPLEYVMQNSDINSAYFDEALFLQEASQYGYDSFMAMLLEEIAIGETHPFRVGTLLSLIHI